MKLEVKDMSCGGCANAITQAIKAVDASAAVSVDIASKVVEVGSALGVERVVEIIEAAGFHPAVVAA
ncbi:MULTISPECIES: heavy-metal-associated domain-containing protein [Burkholderia]|uniref:Heavy-metal-associated domain-containing protein n=2 Tax=Burkholderia humptydooensis TaxID=430531 RepID=A0A7U4SSU2_9BURK|nr:MULTISPECIES: heavy-metal-associated domain-containing protein [Burkholderia]AGK49276.1 heavy-metal-associated domain protein [Burkholderia thailandensis MSMB121]ATF35092.1 copper chaperone [Burkholderia thailandensis]AJY44243.1 heavy-metal-associated domain protein [Burkholderia sp. 2002721687]ALX43971.1 heavy metal transporter [Burkholderia humptydooensis]EIP89665.1 heavy-metal-associated domain protein-related protein [Burkholderia humptydooensis MSMB43]